MEQKTIPLDELQKAREGLMGTRVIQTPLISLNMNIPNKKIYLKCENLQAFGSFKVRGAFYAISQLSDAKRKAGICAASAGNFAQGLGYMANQFDTPCEILVPDYIPETKLSRILELGVRVKKAPFSQWWEAIMTRTYDGIGDLTFIHPCDPNVITGHGTMGLEIVDELPGVNTIICPYGAGGLITGVASAARHRKSDVKILACEPETAYPLKLSLDTGKPMVFSEHKSSFVDGMGGKQVLEEMWPYVSHLVDDSVVVSLEEISEAIRLLIDRNSLVAEGAGAASVAAALSDKVPDGNIVCVISGGNIDSSKLIDILGGQTPF